MTTDEKLTRLSELREAIETVRVMAEALSDLYDQAESVGGQIVAALEGRADALREGRVA